jgi:Ca2+ transporting ATPase
MIMDTLAAFALATEPPNKDISDQIVRRSDRIVTPIMWRNILSQVLYQSIVMLTFLYAGPTIFDIPYNFYTEPEFYEKVKIDMRSTSTDPTNRTIHYTFLLNTFILMTIFNQINSRKLGHKEFNIFSGFFNNFLFIFTIIGELAIQVVLVTFGGMIFRSTTLPFMMNITSLICAIGTWAVAALVKFVSEEFLNKWMKINLVERDRRSS